MGISCQNVLAKGWNILRVVGQGQLTSWFVFGIALGDLGEFFLIMTSICSFGFIFVTICFPSPSATITWDRRNMRE